jgi:hypothetical protein
MKPTDYTVANANKIFFCHRTGNSADAQIVRLERWGGGGHTGPSFYKRGKCFALNKPSNDYSFVTTIYTCTKKLTTASSQAFSFLEKNGPCDDTTVKSYIIYEPKMTTLCVWASSRSLQQGCQSAYFQTKNSDLGKFGSGLQSKMLVNFMPITMVRHGTMASRQPQKQKVGSSKSDGVQDFE